ncbi:two-component regulator propeller domain-containing protein [Rhabdobacter roseus]|uniref:histidine kinase n=1 Tax=Rhabdobacter roseus TaxID=1655419 RepID=A0A840U0J7_9BACT|nr:signal transduction histidine kinase/DNA-binding response OmpR family regulator/ligand-binding sensor domain-containing protein [Rhabdobacter roseus]
MFQDITLADGLSQGMIFDLIEDHEHYVWIATKNGLNRFDGYTYKVFFPDATNPYAISDSQTSALFEDSQGRLWVGTTSQGLNLYDRITRRFYHCSLKDNTSGQSSDKTPNEHISSIQEDPEGNIWVGTFAGKLFKLRLPSRLKKGFPEGPDFTHQVEMDRLNPALQPLNLISVKWIYRTQRGKMWVAFGPWFYELDFRKNQLRSVSLGTYSEFPVTGVLEEADGSLLVTKADRVVRIKNEKEAQTLFFDPNAEAKRGMVMSPDGTVWIRSEGKVYNSHYTTLTKNVLAQEPVFTVGNNCYLTKNLTDSEGNVWLGTNGYGIKKQQAVRKRFRNYLHGYSIWHVIEDRRGRIFSWDYTRIFLLDKKTGQASQQALLTEYEGRQKGNMIEDRNGGFWCIIQKFPGQFDMILVQLDEHLKKVKEYDLHRNGDFVRARLLQDQDGYLWIAGANVELIRFSPASGAVDYYPYGDLLSLNETSVGVNALYQDQEKALWIGTNVGLFRTVEVGGVRTFSQVSLSTATKKSLQENYVYALLDDPKQPERFIWIGTRGGLIRLDKSNRQIRSFTEKDGLGNNVVAGLLSDTQGNLWMSTFRGLSSLNLSTLVFSTYSSRDGLQSDEFNGSCFFKNSQGELIFGGINGLTVFRPDQSWKPEKPASVAIVGLKINNQAVEPHDSTRILSKAIEYTEAISLEHDQNILTFEFSTLDLNNSSKNRYRYRLDGVDTDWIDAGTTRFANYTRLSPGNYTLRVVASFDGSTWTPRPLKLKIHIHPPWYLSAWAYLAYVGLFFGVVYVLYGAQIRRVRLQEQLGYEQREATRLSELDQLKTHFFTNISHEFRTPLTLLVGPIADLQSRYPQEAILQPMRRNADRLLTLINQLLDLGKLESQQMQVQLTEGDLAGYIQILGLSFASLAESRSIAFKVKQNLTEVPARFDPDKIDKIVTNLLANAFKFTQDGNRIRLSVTYDLPKQQAEICVEDTGVGIPPEKTARIFDRFYQVEGGSTRTNEGAGIGLALVKELVDLLGGSISVTSQPGQGTSFAVQLPIDFLGATTLLPGSPHHPTDYQVHMAREVPVSFPLAAETETDRPLMLIAEDNADLRTYIAGIFREEYQILEAQDGQEALEKATERLPDILITDWMMPRLDGLALCQQLRNNQTTSHIPLIMLTAKATVDDRIVGFEQGADDYLTKPFEAREIRARVSSLLRQRQALISHYQQSLVEQDTSPLKELSADELFLEKAKAVVWSHLSESTFDIEQFADELAMSSTQLRRKLRALTGLTPVEFVRKLRLQSAANLLKQKAGSVSEIAFASGFESLSYFSTKFQQEYGVPPSEYA